MTKYENKRKQKKYKQNKTKQQIFIFHYKKITKIDSYKLILLPFIFSIAVGIHGLSHLGLEAVHNFNPF